MLVNKQPNLPTIAVLKLTTGEEIIATVDKSDAGYQVTQPLAMVMAENPDNPTQTRVMFTPWMVAAGDNSILIDKSHVVGFTQPRKDAQEQYEQAVKKD